MKTSSFLLLLFCICGPVLNVWSQDKVALIVAIGQYPATSGWMNINSHNDVPLVKNALLKQGFAEENVFLIQDEDATKDQIIQAIRDKLIAKAKKGSIAYFHYSGHGQQVADDNSDELDGYDEALVPYDSPLEFEAGVYEGENLLRDEELGQLFTELRTKIGPTGNLLAVLDACHSGTGTRGMSPARGTDKAMAPKDYKVTHRGVSKDKNGLESPNNDQLAPMAAFFGAAPNQLNFETKDEDGNGVGSLSYAFCKKFAEADKNTTYRGLFDKIKLEMSAIAPRQQPQAEGELDQQILGGNIVGKVSYYSVKNWNDPTSLVIGGGWLQGLNEGAVIGFYPPETREHSSGTPIITGVVAKCSSLESVVYLDGELDKADALGAWAMVLENSYGKLVINLQLDIQSAAIKEAFTTKMEEYPILKIEQPAELFIIEKDQTIQLVTKDDLLLEEVPNSVYPKTIAYRLTQKILSFSQARFLRKLEVSSFYIPLEFEFVPVKYDRRVGMVTEEIPLAQKTDAEGTVHFKEGDAFQLKVHNFGEKSAYFTLLDIQPDNQINILVPAENEVPADFQVGPGESKTVPKTFEIGPPYGTEVFKLIATDEPIDLRSIVQTRGQTKNANPSPFERLLSDTYMKETTGTRGGRAISISSTKVNVFSQVFIIDP